MTAAIAAGAMVLVLALRYRPRPVRIADTLDHLDRDHARPARSRRPFARPFAARRIGRRRGDTPDPADIADWCGRLSAACRSGSTLSAAMRTTDSPSTATQVVGDLRLALERGAPLTVAIDERTAPRHLDVALTVARACAASGAPAAEPLDRAAAALRARAVETAERATHSAQARLSAVVMTVLPAAMLLVLLATSGPVRGAVSTPIGLGCVIAGALLNAAGWRWMQRIIERAAR